MSAASPSPSSTKRDHSPSNEDPSLAVSPEAGPSKKQKSNTPPPVVAPPKRRKSREFYFSDGNIVLEVGSIDFKVHRSILRRHSTVFKDMFEVGSEAKKGEPASEGGGKGDGVESKKTKPMSSVSLDQDSEGTWEVLLSALYDGTSFAVGRTFFDDLYGLLSLTDKYEFTSLLSRAKRLLVQEVDKLLAPSFDRIDLDDPDLMDDLEPETLVQIIDLGTRFDVPKALPKAFYLLAKSNPNLAELVKDIEDEDIDTGWKIKGLNQGHVVKLFTILQDGLTAQKDFLSSFRPTGPAYHAEDCTGSLCRNAVDRRWKNYWTPKLQGNHLDFRAVLLLMIKDQGWGGSRDCERVLSDELEGDLKSYDESLQL